MKKLIVVLAILAVALAGCATVKDYFCNNRVKIETAIANANTLITSIETTFDGAIPAQYQMVIDAARAVVTTGEAMLAANWCPTDADTNNLLDQSATVQVKLRAATLKK